MEGVRYDFDRDFVGKSVINVDMETFNKILKYAEKARILIQREKFEYEPVSYFAYFDEHPFTDRITMKGKDGKVHTYFVYKDDRSVERGHACPMNVMATFAKYYKIPKIYENKEDAPFSATPFLYFNDKHNYSSNIAYGYDMNSAYTYALKTCRMPDCNQRLQPGIVGCDEVGFNYDGLNVQCGKFALFRFKLMGDTDRRRIMDFCDHWYGIKRNAEKGSADYIKAKDYLNIIIGAFQLHCCFMRSAVVNHSSDIMYDIIHKEGDNILLSNTDSIVSTRHLGYLELGFELGQWKLEHYGTFKYTNHDYQWSDGKTATRGHPKSQQGKDFDILRKNYLLQSNYWKYNYSTNQEERIQRLDSEGNIYNG